MICTAKIWETPNSQQHEISLEGLFLVMKSETRPLINKPLCFLAYLLSRKMISVWSVMCGFNENIYRDLIFTCMNDKGPIDDFFLTLHSILIILCA